MPKPGVTGMHPQFFADVCTLFQPGDKVKTFWVFSSNAMTFLILIITYEGQIGFMNTPFSKFEKDIKSFKNLTKIALIAPTFGVRKV